MNVDELVNQIPPERDLVAFSRALRAVGIDNQIFEGHIACADHELDMDDLAAITAGEDFREAYRGELISWATDHLLSSLHHKGIIEPSVRDDGTLEYQLTEYGALAFEQEYGERPTPATFSKKMLDNDHGID